MIQEGALTQTRHLGILIKLPCPDGQERRARLNWIQEFGEGFYKAGLEFVEPYPYSGGCTVWALKLDKEKRDFIPLFNAMFE